MELYSFPFYCFLYFMTKQRLSMTLCGKWSKRVSSDEEVMVPLPILLYSILLCYECKRDRYETKLYAYIIIYIFYVNHFWSLIWICYNTASALYFVVFLPQGMCDLSALIRDGTHIPALGVKVDCQGSPSILFQQI